MNRFYNIPFIACRELMPWEIKRRELPEGVGLYELETSFRFRSDIAGGIIEIDAGEISDLASIPLTLQKWVMSGDDPRIAGGGWVHDKLYREGGRISVFDEDGTFIKVARLTREQCDKILCDEAMVDLGASRLDRWKVYRGLWVGGRFNFKKAQD
jgi:hypothetical protein